MKAEIITVGTELLIGSTVNTNGPYLSRALVDYGIEVDYHQSIKDEDSYMKEAIGLAKKRSDLIFMVGGLGPTKDDCTKEIVAESYGRDLILDKGLEKKLKDYFTSSPYPMTSNNLKQAYIIEGSRIIENRNGTAAGEYFREGDQYVYLLPGPPREFEPMVDLLVENYLPQPDYEILIDSVKVMLMGESAIESRIRDLGLESSATSINTFAKPGEVEVKIITKIDIDSPDRQALEAGHQRAIEGIYEEFSVRTYAKDGSSLAEALVGLLTQKDQTLSFAESVTGGRLASSITEVPGASNVLKASYVTYSNEAKEEDLGVSRTLLEEKGAVCQEVAEAMAQGLYKRTGASYSLATTGEAGPKPKEDKEVGLVYYSLAKDGKIIKSDKLNISGDRQRVQERATITCLAELLLSLKGGNDND